MCHYEIGGGLLGALMALRDWNTVTLPGRGRFRIPIVGTKKNNEQAGISKAAPEWQVKIAGTGFELFGFSAGTTRDTLGHSGNPLFSGAATRYSDLVIVIENTEYSPVFEQMMNDGSLIHNVAIFRQGWINGTLQTIEERTYKSCYITQFRQILDYLVLFIRTLEREEKILIYDQLGTPDGQVVSNTNQITGTSS